MTPLQKRCQELLPVIQAGAEGKAIEYMWGSEARPLGKDYVGIQFLEGATYRIKPEPEYRPFTPEEALTHCGRKFRGVPGGMVFTFLAVSPNGVLTSHDDGTTDFEWMVMNGRFEDDGSPCGVLVTE